MYPETLILPQDRVVPDAGYFKTWSCVPLAVGIVKFVFAEESPTVNAPFESVVPFT